MAEKKKKQTAYERKMNRNRRIVQIVAILLAALMIGGVLLSAVPAFAITKSEVDALKNKVNAATAKKNDLKKQVSSLNANLNELSKQITLLDGQIEAQEDEIAAQEELLQQLEVLISEKTIELAASEEEQASQYARMKERVRYMAEHDNTSYLTILLASDSFSDFLNRWEIVKQINLRDEQLFEELKAILDAVGSDRVGVCLDTCHVYDGGYDIVNDLDGVLAEFDRVVGLERLKALHLNDSKNPFASHKDRHECLGQGSLGLETFRAIVNHPKLKDKPMILETPNELPGYQTEIALLRSMES